MKLYLAGKIGYGDWRDEIIETRDIQPGDGSKTINGDIYTGPYFISCNHGCCGGDTHGLIDRTCCNGDANQILRDMNNRLEFQDEYAYRCDEDAKDKIPKLCLCWIDDCDVLFAWIETECCYGTFAEIGYAYGKGKEIWIGYSNKLVMGYSDRPTIFSLSDQGNTEWVGSKKIGMPKHDTWFIDRLATKVAVSPNAGMLYSMLSAQHLNNTE